MTAIAGAFVAICWCGITDLLGVVMLFATFHFRRASSDDKRALWMLRMGALLVSLPLSLSFGFCCLRFTHQLQFPLL